jgi:hypothetical protein
MMSSLQGENLFYPIPAVDLQKKLWRYTSERERLIDSQIVLVPNS